MNLYADTPLTTAFRYAATLHDSQTRKGTDIPYLSHLMAVCALVLEEGGNQDEAIAALLHDAVEDCGGQPVLDEIREKFGDTVADIVDGCTDAYETPKPPWKERKQAFIAQMKDASPQIWRVANADKLHNAQSTVRDYEAFGEKIWSRFKATREQTLWYYRTLANVFLERRPGQWLAVELDRVIQQLENAVSNANPNLPENAP